MRHLLPIVLITLTSTTWSAETPKDSPTALFDIKCQKEGDAVAVRTGPGKTTLDITSKTGIGGATITRKGEHWPQTLVLRVRLTGLEQLTIASGPLHLRASVLSHSGFARLLHLWKANREGPQLDRSSPYWMEIGAFDAKGKVAEGLPGQGGWFEMTVPKAMLVDEEKTLTLKWIDFYRR